MEQFEKELMHVFNCSQDWPICLFDFTYKNKIPNYFCFKVEKNLNDLLDETYFCDEKIEERQFGKLSMYNQNHLYQDLMFERNQHIC